MENDENVINVPELELHQPNAADFSAKAVVYLAYQRRKQGLSQADLAALSGVSAATISRIENGESSPTLEMMNKLLIPLGMAVTFTPLDNNPEALKRRAISMKFRDSAGNLETKNVVGPRLFLQREEVEEVMNVVIDNQTFLSKYGLPLREIEDVWLTTTERI